MITAAESGIEPHWKSRLKNEFSAPYFLQLQQFLSREYDENLIFPPSHQLFRAFHLTPFDQVKVVLLGQDPYHGTGQANGLSFSVNKNLKLPPSLRNIYKELESDLGIAPPLHGDLSSWAKQGVLLLNTVLSVRAGQAASHQGMGWELFTDRVIQILSQEKKNLIFLLWGKFAQSKINLIDRNSHFVLAAPHPSPFSAHKGFFGSKPFSKINSLLDQTGQSPIDWRLE